jgi:hypothetical protein
MTVLAFPEHPRRVRAGFEPDELNRVLEILGPELANGSVSGWETDFTEAGDPQLYVLGPLPEQDCILCISRLGRLYVMEDGSGRIVSEHNSLMVLAETMKDLLRKQGVAVVARVALLWCALRQAYHEKVEPVLVEGEEMAAHVALQLGAVA